MRISQSTLIIVYLIAWNSGIAMAGQVENMMNFQARLTNDQGQPLAGNHTLDFFIYGQNVGGVAVGSIPNVPVTIPANANGVVSLPIGPVQEAWFNDAPRFLGMKIDGGTELSPRIRLTAVPFAMRAFNVPTTTNIIVQTAAISGDLEVDGNIGIGTSTPSYRVEIRAPLLPLAQFQGTNRGGLGIVANGSNLAGLDFNGVSQTERPLARIAASIDSSGSGRSKLLFGTSNDFSGGVTNTAMAIDGDGRVVVGTTGSPTKRLVVGTSQMEIDRMPFVSEAIVVGTGYTTASTSTGLFFETGSRSAGGIVVEKMNNGGNEDHRMRFYLVRDGSAQAEERITVLENGYVGISNPNPQDRLDVNGRTITKVLTITGGSDLAEPFDVNQDAAGFKPKPGMVMVIDPQNPGQLRMSSEPYDRRVAGVISGANGLNPGMVMRSEGQQHADGEYNVALTGRVWCWCDATTETGNGSVEPGDLLTTSFTPGHAMRVTDFPRAHGAGIGKAMTRLNEGKGLVLVLVNLQ